jgi:uncharacterized membrane protein|tara:strand:- start:1265 stop:1609 length:345 start_codon:yes stop_codon:yes gene_type:complete
VKVELKIAISKLAIQYSFFILLITLTVNLWLQSAPLVIYFMSLAPLVVFISGIIKVRLRTLIWLCFVLLLYFAIATYKLSVPDPRPLDIAELALIVVLFVAATWNARLRQKNTL